MNKLITLTSQGKFSLIETVVDKLGAKKPGKKEEKKKEEAPSDSWTDVVSKANQKPSTFSPINEEDEFNEEEALEEVKKEEERERLEKGEELQEEEKEEKQIVTLEIQKLDKNLALKDA